MRYVKMMAYLPPYWEPNAEMLEIIKAQGIELDALNDNAIVIFNDGFVMTAGEARIEEWEQDLKISPTGTLDQRKLYIMSKLHGFGKLNEEKIKSIVSAFTGGGGAVVSFSNSSVFVRVLPPHNGEVFLFPDIERSLKPKMPAHIGLVVERFYSTWGDIKEDFTDWNDVKESLDSWNAVFNYIVRE